MKESMNPKMSLLVKLGSIVVHAQEFYSPNGHSADKAALDQCLADPEVNDWIGEMTKLALVPVKRNSG